MYKNNQNLLLFLVFGINSPTTLFSSRLWRKALKMTRTQFLQIILFVSPIFPPSKIDFLTDRFFCERGLKTHHVCTDTQGAFKRGLTRVSLDSLIEYNANVNNVPYFFFLKITDSKHMLNQPYYLQEHCLKLLHCLHRLVLGSAMKKSGINFQLFYLA